MDSYDPRWGDDPRDRDDHSRDLSRGSRGGSDPRERERVEPRDVFVDRVSLPRGPEREHVHSRDRDDPLAADAGPIAARRQRTNPTTSACSCTRTCARPRTQTVH